MADQHQPVLTHERVNLLGVGISAINLQQAVETIDSWINNKIKHYICVTSVHGIIESIEDSHVRRVFNDAGMVTPDGMPLYWNLRIHGKKHTSRVYGPDLLLETCKNGIEKGYRHFFYGGEPGLADDLANKLQARFPGMIVAGTHCPPFRQLTPEEDEEEMNLINSAKPDILWICLSVPKAEIWMSEHIERLNVSAIASVGAAFAFHTGRTRQAPSWVQRIGMEWFFRLLMEPGRLWKRYLVNNSKFLSHLLLQVIGLRKYPYHPSKKPVLNR